MSCDEEPRNRNMAGRRSGDQLLGHLPFRQGALPVLIHREFGGDLIICPRHTGVLVKWQRLHSRSPGARIKLGEVRDEGWRLWAWWKHGRCPLASMGHSTRGGAGANQSDKDTPNPRRVGASAAKPKGSKHHQMIEIKKIIIFCFLRSFAPPSKTPLEK